MINQNMYTTEKYQTWVQFLLKPSIKKIIKQVFQSVCDKKHLYRLEKN